VSPPVGVRNFSKGSTGSVSDRTNSRGMSATPSQDLERGDVRAVSTEGTDISWIPEPPKVINVETPAASSPVAGSSFRESSFRSTTHACRAEEETAVAAFWGEEYNNRFTEDFPLEFAQSQYRPGIFVHLNFILGATCPRPQAPVNADALSPPHLARTARLYPKPRSPGIPVGTTARFQAAAAWRERRRAAVRPAFRPTNPKP